MRLQLLQRDITEQPTNREFSPSAACALLNLYPSAMNGKRQGASRRLTFRALTVSYPRICRSFLILFLSLCLLPSSQAAAQELGGTAPLCDIAHREKRKIVLCAVEFRCGAGYDVEGIKASLRPVCCSSSQLHSKLSFSQISVK